MRERIHPYVVVSAESEVFIYTASINDVKPSIFKISDLFDSIGEAIGRRTIITSDTLQKPNEVFHALRDKYYLLVIDNFETLPDEEKKKIVDFLNNRDMFPDTCKAIVTSRYMDVEEAKPVRVDGMSLEECWELIKNLLDDQDVPESLVGSETIVEELWRETSGCPLAIQWIIGRAKYTGKSLTDIINNLHSVDPDREHDTEPLLEYIFGESYKILSPHAKRILQTLSILPASLSRLALSHVSAIDSQCLNEEIPILLKMSLIEGYSNRFRLLQLTRYFVQKELQMDDPSVESDVLQNTVNYYLEFFKGSAGGLAGKVAAEQDNILAAIDWCAKNSLSDNVIRLSRGILPHLFSMGYWNDCHHIADLAVDASQLSHDTENEVYFTLCFLSQVSYAMRHYDEALSAALRGLEISRREKLLRGEALALQMLGLIDTGKENFQEAKNFLLNALIIAQECNEEDLILQIEQNIADVYMKISEFDEAKRILTNRLMTADSQQVRADTLGRL